MGGLCGKVEPGTRRGFAARVVDACVCRVSEDTEAWAPTEPRKRSVSDEFDIIHYDAALVDLLKVDRQATVVFIFGGPGSKKGIFVENLVQSFGFRLVSTEDIILRHLPLRIEERARREGLVFGSTNSNTTVTTDSERTASSDKETSDTAQGDSPPNPTWYSRGPSATTFAYQVKLMLQDYPDELTLQWVMGHIVDEIVQARKQGHTMFLVDMLPNFDFMYVHAFSMIDCSREMIWLEKQFTNVAMFAILMSISNQDFDEMFTGLNDYTPEASELNIKSEIDISQIKRRQSSFLAAMRPYFEYFRRTGRIIDVTPAKAKFDYIWQKLNQVLLDLGFLSRSAAEIVIFFTTGGDDLKAKTEKWLRLGPRQRKLSTMADLQKEFKMYCSGKSAHRLIICDTKLCQYLPKSDEKLKQIRFMEEGDAISDLALDQNAVPSQKLIIESKSYRTISCPGNVLCFFPARMDENTCRLTAAQIANMLRQEESN